MNTSDTESQKKAIRGARAAAKRLDEGTTSRPSQTVSTWAKHMKAYIRGAK